MSIDTMYRPWRHVHPKCFFFCSSENTQITYDKNKIEKNTNSDIIISTSWYTRKRNTNTFVTILTKRSLNLLTNAFSITVAMILIRYR
ncbi:hypothetical protein QTP88_022505 [Uroleucon formosanum]